MMQTKKLIKKHLICFSLNQSQIKMLRRVLPLVGSVRSKLKPLSRVSNRITIQYTSDIHIDRKKCMPTIIAKSDYLAVCGDVGDPFHPNFKLFFDMVSPMFKVVFFVAGNHDLNCSPMYEFNNVSKCKKQIKSILKSYANVQFLNRKTCQIGTNIVIVGTTLWSEPLDVHNLKYINYLSAHYADIKWLEDTIEKHKKKKVVVLTHYVPTEKLIRPMYLAAGAHVTSLFATDLESVIGSPVVGWLCGHTHSILDVKINGVYCGVNALGNFHNVIQTKLLVIE